MGWAKDKIYIDLQNLTSDMFKYLLRHGEMENKEIRLMANYLYKKQIKIIDKQKGNKQ